MENTVKAARRQAEAAAKVALERLHVGSAEPGSHLSAEERQLRNRLRAHGRQLGDQRDPKTGAQPIRRLLHECAYEHWHRMLFARFLAENHLLMHPDGVAVTLAECEELAVGEGAADGWSLAGRYAARMLPQIFRPDDPVLQVSFAPEHKRALEKLVTDLVPEVFTAEDSLGWVYQFWQAERKDEVNKSGDKITGETLPAVTQLFTEHYMVLFLLHNTIGAWWAARLISEDKIPKADWDKCQTEDDCRKLVALPGLNWEYLRFVRDGENGPWRPAAGAFPGWPKALKEFKLLDPCCGSGHMLIAAFDILVRLRMADEKLTAQDACDAVLRENLHGLELDPRCTQIAAFALALTAWKFTDSFRPLPPMNIACSGLGVNARKDDWLALANGDTRLRSGLEQLYDLFQKAPELGSLINPRQLSQGDLVTASFAELQPLLTKALQSERAKKNDDLNEIGVAARGMASAANLMSASYGLVLTNVPYLGRGKQGDTLKDHCERLYADGKADLATCFITRCLEFCQHGGSTAVVAPQGWLFLGSYRDFRRGLLTGSAIDCLATLGEEAWQAFRDRGPSAVLVVLSKAQPAAGQNMSALDALPCPTIPEKQDELRRGTISVLSQAWQFKNPDHRLKLTASADDVLLSKHAKGLVGIQTGDNPYYMVAFWELPHISKTWETCLSPPEGESIFAGREHLIRWEQGSGRLQNDSQARVQGVEAFGRWGVAFLRVREVRCALYCGEIFEQNAAVILPADSKLLPAIWAYCCSPEYAKELRLVDRAVKVTNASLVKVPFNLAHWQRVAAEKYPNGLPEPSSNDVTQWLFAGHPVDSTAPLQVGVARLLGYRWPRQTGQTVSGAPPVPPDGLEKFVDGDGIVCIPSVRGEQPAADRVRELLIAAYGKQWSPTRQDELLASVDYAGSTLEDWLRNGFFEQHYKLFHHRPFIFQIWDGRKDGFSALVNYHRLDHKLLEKLTYTYLGEWIKKQQDAVAQQESGADDRLLKARQLQDKLKLILEGETPHDIFVRWKPLEQQPIGWHPDLNDGVRLNIRPFIEAGVLRKTPNIKWGKDRGKNPPGSPWGDERDNDRHLTLEEKRKAK